MVKLNRIYTRTGDNGTTGLVDGSRVSKADPLMAAIGTVEETNAVLGLALLDIESDGHRAMVSRIQNELFDLGADLATPYVAGEAERSEEHTSELQSLMRTSYAVFCFIKNNNTIKLSKHRYAP